MSKSSRVVMVEIQGESEFLVNRFADLIVDEIQTVGTFVQGAMEHYASFAASADDPAAEVPTFQVTSTSAVKGGKSVAH